MRSTKANFFQIFKNSLTPSNHNIPSRRFDLDWLRVLVFGLLILYHIGMMYVANWGFHIKSNYQSALLENLMLVVEPWRMPLLWLISGIAIRFVLAKISIWRFISMRSMRLLLPLLFGIIVVVPPQLFIEMSYKGTIDMNYWQFLQAFFAQDSTIFTDFEAGIWPHMDVNHLWYIRALWQYSLLLVVLLPLLNSAWVGQIQAWLFHQKGPLAILLALLPLVIIQLLWHQDTVRYPLGFIFLLYGYLIGWDPAFWHKIKPNLKALVVGAFICFIALLCFYNLVWLSKTQSSNQGLMAVGMFVYSLMRLLGVLVLCSFAYNFLNKKSKNLSYFSQAVYPFYILHQTIIIVVGYYLSQQNLGPVVEPLLLILITVAGCFLGFELIRRVEILRPCFGLKMRKSYHPALVRLGYLACGALLLPIGVKILVWSRDLIFTLF